MEAIIVITITLATLHFLHDVFYNKPVLANEINPKALQQWMESQEGINKDIGKCLGSVNDALIEHQNNHRALADYTIKTASILAYEVDKLSVEGRKCNSARTRQSDFIKSNCKRTKLRNSISSIGGLTKR